MHCSYRRLGLALIAPVVTMVSGPAPALAQSDNIVTSAQDAFGSRIGLEAIGLYNETEVRGFNLATAGNYRIDGSYYVPQNTLPDPLIGGVIVHVGWNALQEDFPAPSGVVEYQLRSASPGVHLALDAGLVPYVSPYLDAESSARTSDGRWAIAGGMVWKPRVQWADGTIEKYIAAGAAPEWRPNAATLVKVFAGGSYDFFPGAYQFQETGPSLPPVLTRYPGRYQASWAEWRPMSLNTGAIAKTSLKGWSLSGALVYSWLEYGPGDFTILQVDPHGAGEAIGINSHNGLAGNLAGELKFERSFGQTRIYGMFRAREDLSKIPAADVRELGAFDIRAPTPATSVPPPLPTVRSRDVEKQTTAGLGLQSYVGRRLQLRLGVQRTNYEQAFTPPGGALAMASGNSYWLYNGALVYALNSIATLFATTTRGIEESGLTPANAANRNQILPAIVAQQYEVGLHLKLTPKVSLIASAFQIAKPTPGLDSMNIYRLIGDERHRGIELSITGQATPRLFIVVGGVLLQPTISGQQTSTRPTGVASELVQASFSYVLSERNHLSIDGVLNYRSDELINPVTGLTIPPLTTLDLGLRKGLQFGRRSALLRVYVSNVANVHVWQGDKTGLIWMNSPRGLRATLVQTFP